MAGSSASRETTLKDLMNVAGGTSQVPVETAQGLYFPIKPFNLLPCAGLQF